MHSHSSTHCCNKKTVMLYILHYMKFTIPHLLLSFVTPHAAFDQSLRQTNLFTLSAVRLEMHAVCLQ